MARIGGTKALSSAPRTASTGPSKAKLTGVVSKAFSAQYPPRYTRILELQKRSLKFGAPRADTVKFKFTAKAFRGTFAGTRPIGTQAFTGSYNLLTHAVSFREV